MVGYASKESCEGAPRTTSANKGANEEQALRSKSDGPMRRRATVRRLRRTNRNLCFFRSLSKFVQEHEREIEHSAANKDKFWDLVVEQYREYHDRERLERCWDVKTAVTKCILDANGTNDYKLPHGIKHEEPIFVDIFLDSDDTDDPVARTLDYEGLHASLPSSLPR